MRGETTSLIEYTRTELERVLYAAAEMHDCDVAIEVTSESPRVDSDPELRTLVGEVAKGVRGVDAVVPTADFGASEDATYFVERVQSSGGLATYLVVVRRRSLTFRTFSGLVLAVYHRYLCIRDTRSSH